jgi:hypothetical protein
VTVHAVKDYLNPGRHKYSPLFVIMPWLSVLRARLFIVTNSPVMQPPALKKRRKEEAIRWEIVKMERTEFIGSEQCHEWNQSARG